MPNPSVSILIVDDEPSIRSVLEETLKQRYACVAVESAADALRLMDARKFDLALVDIGLPGMSGLTLCTVIVNQYPNTRVITISGDSDEESIAEARKAGASDYIAKPFNIRDVVAAVDRTLTRGSPGDAPVTEI
jgi:DNA-binding response OmpR family regulator